MMAVYDCERYEVFAAPTWSAAWQDMPGLRVSRVTWCAAPKTQSAELYWYYGEGMLQGDRSPKTYSYADLAGWWVKIVFYPYAVPVDSMPRVWCGIIAEDHDNPSGSDTAGNERLPAGSEVLLAYGPEILLDRKRISTSYYKHPSEDKELACARAITFNEDHKSWNYSRLDHKHHGKHQGNRSNLRGDEDTYLFAGLLYDAKPWTILDIVEYLIAYQSPEAADGSVVVPFVLDPHAIEMVPDWGRPVLAAEGQTTKSLLDHLLDRRRGLGYTIELRDATGDGEALVIRPFTFADTEITISQDGSEVLAANVDRFPLDFDDDTSIERAVVRQSCTQRYQQVIASGARIICCGTISGKDETLVAHWSVEQEVEYDAGASLADDYDDLDTHQQEERNALVRQAEHLRRVYGYYGLPLQGDPDHDAWDGLVGDGTSGPESKDSWTDLFPYEKLGWDREEDAAFWMPGLRFLRELPLKSDHDYSAKKVKSDEVADDTPEGYRWHYRPIYVLMRISADDAATERYCQVEHLGLTSTAELLGAGNGRLLSASVQVQDDAPGIILQVSGGHRHELAKSDFEGTEADGETNGYLDWRDNLLVTFAVEADARVEVAYPAEGNVEGGEDVANILRIDASKHAALHWLAPNTVIDCKDGELVRSTSGGWIRDDRPLLHRIARLAYQWYGQPRQAISLQIRGLDTRARIGDLVTEIGSGATAQSIRSVVTEITYELAQDERSVHTTRIETQWAELDPLELIL